MYIYIYTQTTTTTTTTTNDDNDNNNNDDNRAAHFGCGLLCLSTLFATSFFGLSADAHLLERMSGMVLSSAFVML